MNKKGVLGLDTARQFILLILIVAVIAFALVILLGTLKPVTEDLGEERSDSLFNESQTMNQSVTVLDSFDLGLTRYNCAVTNITYNGSRTLPSTNFSVDSSLCTVIYLSSGTTFPNGTAVNVTYSFTARSASAKNILQNVSAGTERFFQDAETWFILLSVVIIILIIAVVVVAVGRFGQGGAVGTGNAISGGTRNTEFEGL